MENQKGQFSEDENTIDLREIFYVLRRHMLVILITGIILGGCVYVYTRYFVTPEYQSTTKVYVLPKTSTTSSGDVTNSDLTAGTQLTKDYIQLVKSRPVLEHVIAALGLDMTTAELSESITAEAVTDTRILTINVLNPNPVTARDIANVLREQVSQQLTSVMNADSVNTVEDASLPTTQATPNVLKNTLLGFLIGIVVACVIYIIQYMYDDTLKSPDDVEQKLGLTTLAVLPSTGSSREEKKKQKKVARATFHKVRENS